MRAKSLFAHARRYNGEYRNFVSFVRDKLIERRDVWWHWPVSVFATMANRFSGQPVIEAVLLEHVGADRDRLGIIIDEFPREHVLEDSTPDVISEIANLINLWAGDDFRLGGYLTVGAMPRHSLPNAPQPNWCLHA